MKIPIPEKPEKKESLPLKGPNVRIPIPYRRIRIPDVGKAVLNVQGTASLPFK